MPVTRSIIATSCAEATDIEIKGRRPDRKTWPDDIKLGRDDGEGYNFRAQTVGKMAATIYSKLRCDARLSAIASKIVFPPGFPREDFLGNDLRHFRRWIVSDISRSANIPPDPPAQETLT